MIVLKCNKPLSKDLAERVRAEWERCMLAGLVPVLGPEFDVVELRQPVMSGPLVSYLAQLGDA